VSLAYDEKLHGQLMDNNATAHTATVLWINLYKVWQISHNEMIVASLIT
jgi:hypothetical protein